MEVIQTTATGIPSKLWSVIKLVLFVLLYTASLVITLTLSFATFVGLATSDGAIKHQEYQIELNWYDNYAYVPGAKAYAAEMLKQDADAAFPYFMIGEVVAVITPFVLIGLGLQCLRRRTINLTLNSQFCWLYSSVLVLFVIILHVVFQ